MRLQFVVGIEDKPYFHWQLPILLESLVDQLPEGACFWVVVCNNHRAPSDALQAIFNAYDQVRWLTGTNHPRNENLDFTAGDTYVPLNKIEALNVVGRHLRDHDLLVLMETDMFLYRELNPAIFPAKNTLCENGLIRQERFFSYRAEPRGIRLDELLQALQCGRPFKPGGVGVFLEAQTVKNDKFIQDCFRFTHLLYLMGSIMDLKKVWPAEMPCYALSMTYHGIHYQVMEIAEFSTANFADPEIKEGTFFHYYHDKNDGGDGAFHGSEWYKQLYYNTNLLVEADLSSLLRASRTDHEKYFFELSIKARGKVRG